MNNSCLIRNAFGDLQKSLSNNNAVVEVKKGEDLRIVYALDTPKQMGNVDQDWSVEFIKRAAQAKKPFYLEPVFS